MMKPSRLVNVFASPSPKADPATKALIPFLTAGFPKPSWTVPLMHALVQGGADLIELGMPFSDPMADGPIIEAAGHQALAQGTDLETIFTAIAEFRTTNKQTPLVLMGYVNPVECYGYRAFADRARAVGVDGVLLVDLPLEEAETTRAIFEEQQLSSIYLIAPTTPTSRIARIAEAASGYLYAVSLKGVTGAQSLDVSAVREEVARIRAQTSLPIAVGFGIATADQARAVSQFADGIIIGSRLIAVIDSAFRADPTMESVMHAATEFLRQIKRGMSD